MIYDFLCECGKIKEVSMRMSDYKDNIYCDCGLKMNLKFNPIAFKISNTPYDYGKSCDAEKEQKIALDRTGGWN